MRVAFEERHLNIVCFTLQQLFYENDFQGKEQKTKHE